MHDPTRPDLEERYAHAVDSNRLVLEPEHKGDVDHLISAGWTREGLGTALYRTRVEFGLVRGELMLAARVAAAQARESTELRTTGEKLQTTARKAPKEERERMLEQAGLLNEQALQAWAAMERAALTARALAMVHLKSLHGTAAAVHVHAWKMARRMGLGIPYREAAVVPDIAARALQLWLDPACPHCEGRGFNGGHGVPRTLCQECEASGKRRWGPRAEPLAKSVKGRVFGAALLADMDRKADRVSTLMRQFLRSQAAEEAMQAQPAALLSLHQTLRDLRSTKAEAD